MKPSFNTMSLPPQNLPHKRDCVAKDDDQIAYENGYSCECVERGVQALTWYAEVKPTGGRWDVMATAGRVAVLVACRRAGEAVQLGVAGLARMGQPSALLVNEVARAWNQHSGPEHALSVCRTWAEHAAIINNIDYWHSVAAYAAQCGQFAMCLESLLEWLKLRSRQQPCDVLLDMDFVPLWRHLSEGLLTQAEANALQSPLWPNDSEGMSVHNGRISFESYAKMPSRLRAILCLQTTSMTWHLRPHTAHALIAAYSAWRKETRLAHFGSLLAGQRKVVAFKAPVNTE